MTDESREQESRDVPEEEQRGLQQAIEVRHGDSSAPAVEGVTKEPRRHVRRSSASRSVTVSYNGKPAVRDVSFDIGKNEITALIGPSGCGKSTLLRCLNRMNDLIPGATVDGKVSYHGQDLYGSEVDAGRGPQADRHGLPEAQPVPQVDLRQHRLRARGCSA